MIKEEKIKEQLNHEINEIINLSKEKKNDSLNIVLEKI